MSAVNRVNASNFISAGKAAVNNSITALQAARENAPKYDELVREGRNARAKEKAAAFEAESDVAMAGIRAEAQVRNAKINADENKSLAQSRQTVAKAGKIAAAGQLIGGSITERRQLDERKALLEKFEAKDIARAERDEQRHQEHLAALRAGDTPSTSTTAATVKPGDVGIKPTVATNTPTPSVDVAKPVVTPTASSKPSKPRSSGSLNFNSVQAMAAKAGAKYPKLVAAQWALESGYGSSELASTHNNLFGQKGEGVNYSTQEDGPGGMHTIRDNFKTFNSPQDSVNYLVDRWYKDFGNYKGVNNASSPEAAAQMLRDQGYATDRNYVNKLTRIMNEN